MISTPLKIGFIGNINAMPMGYALLFKEAGCDVKYIVEADRDDALMRPEHHHGNAVAYPYPEWIKEIPIGKFKKSKSIADFLRKRISGLRAIYKEMQDRDVLVVNDYGIALSAFFKDKTVVVVSSGSDIDVRCLYPSFSTIRDKHRSFIFAICRYIVEVLITATQRKGLSNANVVSYFPTGLNLVGDQVIRELSTPDKLIPRYDLFFEATHFPPVTQDPNKIVVIAPVRFCIHPDPAYQRPIEYKGNDHIVRALVRFHEALVARKQVEIHLFEKGNEDDVAWAKQYLLTHHVKVIWHKELPLHELLDIYAKANVCIDQVGSHWMGGVGLYALKMGIPVIANDRREVLTTYWGAVSPVIFANNEDTVFEGLMAAQSQQLTDRLAIEGPAFVDKCLKGRITFERLYKKIARVLPS